MLDSAIHAMTRRPARITHGAERLRAVEHQQKLDAQTAAEPAAEITCVGVCVGAAV
jgi:hypothetical protein